MLINLRNALMAGKRLPYDAEVEYLQSSGNSSTVVKMWVDTGVEALANTAIEVTFQHTDTSYGYAMGQGQLNGRRFAVAGIRSNSRLWSLAYNSWHDFSISADTSTHTFSLDGVLKTGSVDGTSISFSDSYTSEGGTIGLFCRNCSGGTVQNWGCNGKLYSCKIWQNGVLVRDFIPVRKGTVGYLYDRVSGKLFGNAGTGDFVLGPDVVPVEYIESHGAEYIDTGVMSSRCYGAYLDFKAIDFASYMYFVSNATADDFCVGTNANSTANPYIGRIRRSLWYSGSIDKTAFVALSCKGGKILLNDVEKVTYDDTLPLAQNDNTIRMFGLSGTQRLSKCAIRRFDLYNSSQDAIFKALPVRVGTEGAMMDVLTRRIYRNQGTGAFIYGNDLKYPIPAA